MGTLTGCLSKLGKALTAEDAKTLKDTQAEYQASGMSPQDAALRAIEDFRSTEIDGLRPVVEQITAKGGALPDAIAAVVEPATNVAQDATAEGSIENPLPESRLEDAPVGSWVQGPTLPGLGPIMWQVREVPLSQIADSELQSDGDLVPEKRRDGERYAERMRSGERYPNARGSELENGKVKLQDGHRRLWALRQTGATTMRIAVNPIDLPAASTPRGQDVQDGQAFTGDERATESNARPAEVRKSASAQPARDTFQGITPDQARNIARDAWGGRLVKRLTDSGILNFVTSEEARKIGVDAPLRATEGDRVAGFYVDGKAYIVADQIKPEEVAGVVLHEVGEHYGMERMLGADLYNRLLRLVERRGESGTDPEIRKAWESAKSAGTPDANMAQETLAYLLEQSPGNGIVTRVVDAIKAFLNRLGVPMSRLENEAELLRRVGRESMRMAGKEGAVLLDGQGNRLGPQYSRRGSDQTQTPEFKRWFGNSKVVDESGEPKVVYHGTTADITRFNDAMRGSNTGAESAKMGFFFTDDTVTAESYANFAATDAKVQALLKEADAAEKRGDWDTYDAKVQEYEALDASFNDPANRAGGQNVVPVFLSMQNPLTVDAKGENAAGFDIPAAIKKAVRAGRDGLIIRNLDDAANIANREATHYVIFKPTQIKSAIGNSGAFDPANPDIRYSRRTPQQAQAEAAQNRATLRQQLPAPGPVERVRAAIDRASDFVRAPFESAVDKLRRKPGTKELGDAVAKYFDQARARQGKLNAILRPVTMAAGKDDLAAFEKIMAAIENGRKDEARSLYDAASKKTKDLIGAWRKVEQITGEENQRVGVKVYDPKIGKWRPIGRVAAFWPRVIKDKYRAAMHDPQGHPKEWAEMVTILMAEGYAADAEDAQRFLNTQFNDTTSNEYFAGIERARGEKLPEALYDYGWEQAIRYKDSWAERISQIEAFGQSGPEMLDLFQKAQAGTLDKRMQEYIQRVSDVVYNKQSNRYYARALQTLNTGVTGLHLGNPASATLNLIGAFTLTFQANDLRYALTGLKDLYNLRSAIKEAYSSGVLIDDYFGLSADSQADQVPGLVRKSTDVLLTYGGFNLAEKIGRAHNLLTAKAFLRDSLRAWNKNVKSRKSKRAIAWLQRNGIDYRDLLRENGSGEATDKFLRTAVNQTQGSYRIDQAPVFTDEPLGRFLLKYQKFSTQVVRMFVRNHLKPFYDSIKGGEKVKIEVDGKEIESRVTNFIPLLRYFVMAVPAGLMAEYLRAILFGYSMSGPDDEELKRALADNDTARALGLAIERSFSAIVSIGALGFIGNYGQALLAWQDRQRFKNPLQPPALAPLDVAGTLLVKGVDQGKLTLEDVDQAFENLISLYRTGKRLAGTVAMEVEPDSAMGVAEQARRDRAWVRKMARRYADEAGIEAKRRAPDVPVFTENTPTNREIRDALLVGDAGRAMEIARQNLYGLKSKKEIQNRMQSIQSSIRAFRPALVMESQSALEAKRFLLWARDNLSEEGFARLYRVDRTYMDAAKASGLWNWREVNIAKEEESRAELSERAVQRYVDSLLEKGSDSD